MRTARARLVDGRNGQLAGGFETLHMDAIGKAAAARKTALEHERWHRNILKSQMLCVNRERPLAGVDCRLLPTVV